MGALGTYQLFAAGGEAIGGIMTKTADTPVPIWLYYFNVDAVEAALQRVNEALWDIEDRIRDKELAREFDAVFIDLARAVYVTNDERAAIKKRINLALGSRIVEEKSYKPYR